MELILIALLMLCITSSSLDIVHSQSNFNVVDFGATGDGQTDDSQAFSKGWQAVCGATGGTPTLIIPGGKTFLLKPSTFQGPCKSSRVAIQVAGNIVAPNSMDAYKEGAETGWWLGFESIDGLILNGTGKFDGRGSLWWMKSDYKPFNQENGLDSNIDDGKRPTALHFHQCNNITLTGFTSVNSPKMHIKINNCNGATISNVQIIAPEDSPNTDGINTGYSTQVSIHDSFIGTGDDCIAIKGGSSYIKITNVQCGPGHGISVGSLGANGANDTVEEVHVRQCTFNGTDNGVRIKTWQGGQGYVKSVTFEQITLINTKNPIIIDQNYCNGEDNCPSKAGAIKVSDVTFSRVEGTSKTENAITLNCAEIGCTNVILDQINITSSEPQKETSANCQNAQGKESATTPVVPCLKET